MSNEIKKKNIKIVIAIVILIIVIILGICLVPLISSSIVIKETQEKLRNINAEELQNQIIAELEHSDLNIDMTADSIKIETVIDEGIRFKGYTTAKIGCLQNGTVVGVMEIPCFKINSDNNGKFKSIEYTQEFMKKSIIDDVVRKIFKNNYDLENFDEIRGSKKYRERFNANGTSGEIYCSDNEFFIIILKRLKKGFNNYSVNDYNYHKDLFDGLKKYQTTTFGLEF